MCVCCALQGAFVVCQGVWLSLLQIQFFFCLLCDGSFFLAAHRGDASRLEDCAMAYGACFFFLVEEEEVTFQARGMRYHVGRGTVKLASQEEPRRPRCQAQSEQEQKTEGPQLCLRSGPTTSCGPGSHGEVDPNAAHGAHWCGMFELSRSTGSLGRSGSTHGTDCGGNRRCDTDRDSGLLVTGRMSRASQPASLENRHTIGLHATAPDAESSTMMVRESLEQGSPSPSSQGCRA